ELIDLSAWPDGDREFEAERRILAITQRPFDLNRDLMLRAAVLTLGSAEHILLIVTHHIAFDGWSRAILFREIAAFYEANRGGQPAPLPALPIQYADFAHWQRQWLTDQILNSQLAYWKRQLAEMPALLALPTDRPRPAVQGYHCAHQSRA